MIWNRFFTRPKIIVYIIVLVFGGFVASRIFRRTITDSILTDTVKRQDIVRTVLATGQVVSETDLELSFKASGRVSRVWVRLGDRVRAGQILVALNQASELGALKSAQGTLEAAEANYQKILEGARTEEVAVAEAAVSAAQVALDNARQSLATTVSKQGTLVSNAYRALLNTSLTARAETIYDPSVTLTITGTYTGTIEGEYRIKLISTGNLSYYYQVSGLESYTGLLERGKTLPLGEQGLFITFGTAGTLSQLDSWVIAIPNQLSSSYITNYNAYQSALKTQSSAIVDDEAAVAAAETALNQKLAELALKKIPARPSDIAAARASVLSGEGQVLGAQAALENTVIRAPAAGTITKLDIKPGEVAAASAAAIVLQDVGQLYLEANIPEADVAAIGPGQKVSVDFDALGPDKIYQAAIAALDPAATVISGTVNYRLTARLENTAEIKPGLTANLKIFTGSRENALAVPARAIETRDGKKFVRLVIDSKTKSASEQEITTGLSGDDGLVEVISGLDEGEEIIIYSSTP